MRIQSVSSRVGWMIALAAMVVVAPRALFAQTEVTTCEQVYSGAGFLSADLDCSGVRNPIPIPEYVGKLDPPDFAPTGVLIKNGGSLDLRGHTLNLGGLATPGPDFGVFCMFKSCKVFNGTITNALAHGVSGDRNVEIDKLTITNSGQVGLEASRGVVVVNSTITGNAGIGVRAERAAKLTGSTVSGNGKDGVAGTVIVLRSSNVAGNSTAGPCDSCPGACPDLRSIRRPRLHMSTCSGLSLDMKLSQCAFPGIDSWHVCAGD